MITIQLQPEIPALALVSCVRRKRPAPAPARDLYCSPWFGKARALVDARGWPWHILSARYGLLHPDAVVAPYDLTLKTMSITERRAWAAQVLAQIAGNLGEPHQLVIFAGDRYIEFLAKPLAELGHQVVRPLAGLGIGQQLHALDKLYEATGTAATSPR